MVKYFVIARKGERVFVQGPISSLQKANRIAGLMSRRYDHADIVRFIKRWV